MINSDFRKKMADSWFSYLQNQICKEFEFLEKVRKKFIKRDWNKKNKKEGGGTSFFLSGGSVFEKVGVNKSTVSGKFTKEFRQKILGASKNGKYWAFHKWKANISRIWKFLKCIQPRHWRNSIKGFPR